MKRVKVMLLTIAVIAVAAGTLAFKSRFCCDICTVAANETAPGQYTCTTTNPAGGNRPLTCSAVALNRKAGLANIAPVCTTFYTTTEVGGAPTCVNATNYGLTRLIVE